MTKTGHIATITQLEDAAISYDKRDIGDSVNIIDKDLDNQICEVVQEDLVNNNESKGVVLGDKHSAVIEDDSVINEKVSYSADGYDYLGFRFLSKLKFPNIIGICVIHMLFVYTFFNTQQLPTSLWTYAWGKVLNHFFFLYFCFLHT